MSQLKNHPFHSTPQTTLHNTNSSKYRVNTWVLVLFLKYIKGLFFALLVLNIYDHSAILIIKIIQFHVGTM
jgi:hypothetical protein